MGYLKSVATSFVYIVVFLAAITFIPGLPPTSKFAEYSILSPKKLTGDLDVNERLNNAEILFKGELKGPEDFATYNGELYTGIHGGYVVKVTDKQLIPIVKFGKECDGDWQEAKCGRPLGLKFDSKGALFVCDAYYGIYKVDVKSGKYERIVNSDEPIEGKKPMITNFIDIAKNGDLYWSDSSTEFPVENGVFTWLSNPSGRLIRYNAQTKKNEVLVHDLGGANGVALSKNEDFVIVCESLTSRITKYNLKGPNAGKREIFIEGLPGIPDNIQSDGQGGFLVSLVAYADENNPQLCQSLIPHPNIRKMAARLLTLIELPFNYLQLYCPNYYFERIIHFIGNFESVMFMSPPIVTVLRLSEDGKILNALYATDGKITGISTAYIYNNYLYLGSPWVDQIARVPLSQALPELSTDSPKETKSNKSKPVKKVPHNDKKPSLNSEKQKTNTKV